MKKFIKALPAIVIIVILAASVVAITLSHSGGYIKVLDIFTNTEITARVENKYDADALDGTIVTVYLHKTATGSAEYVYEGKKNSDDRSESISGMVMRSSVNPE